MDNRALESLTVNYENGNARSQLVAISSDGRNLGPADLTDGTLRNAIGLDENGMSQNQRSDVYEFTLVLTKITASAEDEDDAAA